MLPSTVIRFHGKVYKPLSLSSIPLPRHPRPHLQNNLIPVDLNSPKQDFKCASNDSAATTSASPTQFMVTGNLIDASTLSTVEVRPARSFSKNRLNLSQHPLASNIARMWDAAKISVINSRTLVSPEQEGGVGLLDLRAEARANERMRSSCEILTSWLFHISHRWNRISLDLL
jgi:hypothetical protein